MGRFLPLVLVVLPLACSRGAESASSLPPAVEQRPKPPLAPPRVEGPLGEVLESYEAIRAALAADDASDVPTLSRRIANASKPATTTFSAEKAAALAAIGTAAGALAGVDPAKIEDARLAFGVLSKELVALLLLDASLQTGRFIFECPMAAGYKKWVQTSRALKNPYMGKRMLECGEETAWKQ